MRDERRILINTLFSFSSRGASAVTGLVLVPFLLVQLGEETYGVIGLLASIMGFMTLIDLGMRPAAARQFTLFVAQGDTERANEVATSALVGYGGIAVVLMACFWLGGESMLRSFGVAEQLLPASHTALVLVGVSLSIGLLSTPYRAGLVSRLRHDIGHIAETLNVITRATLVVVLFLVWEPSLVVYAGAGVVGMILIYSIVRWQCRRLCPELRMSRARVTRRGFRDLAGIGVLTSITQLANWVNLQAGPIVIGSVLGTVAVAHYTPAMALVSALRALSQGFLVQLQPVVTRAFVRRDFAQIQSLLIRSTRYTLLLSGGAAAWVGSMATLLVPVWLGESFEDTGQVLALWCVALALTMSVGSAFPIFLAMGRLRLVTTLNAVVAVANLLVGIWLVAYTDWGILGVTLANVVTQAARTAFYIVWASSVTQLPLRRYLVLGHARPVACLAITSAFSIGLQRVTSLPPAPSLAVVALATAFLYAALVWWLGFDSEDRTKACGYLAGAQRRVMRFLGTGD